MDEADRLLEGNFDEQVLIVFYLLFSGTSK
jgi:hypothetical protein